MAFLIWRCFAGQRHEPEPGIFSAARDLATSQAPALLQAAQLWPVLAALAMSTNKEGSAANSIQGFHIGQFASELWEMKYVQNFQFSVESMRGFLYMQCFADSTTVRYIVALLAPVVPLLVLLGCMVLEAFQRSSGLAVALQAITLLYIGGASSCSDLLSCQSEDGAGEPLPPEFVYRKLLPSIRCNGEDATGMRVYVDAIGYITAFCYGVLIPAGLVHLYAKAQVVMQPSRTSAAVATDRLNELTLSLGKFRDLDLEPKEDKLGHRHLVASATAYISVLLRGRVRMRLTSCSANFVIKL